MKLLALFFILTFNSYSSVKTGETAPSFTLTDMNQKNISLEDFKGKYIVLEWFNKDCPFVRKHYDSKNMQTLQKSYTEKDVVWLSIISSAPNKQGHLTAKEALSVFKKENMKSTHFLIDEKGTVGKKYGAQTTPHMFIVNPKGKVAYQGAIDSIPSYQIEDIKKAKNFVKENLDKLLSGKKVATAQTKSYGCSVKY